MKTDVYMKGNGTSCLVESVPNEFEALEVEHPVHAT
jgi:hypothetical protein